MDKSDRKNLRQGDPLLSLRGLACLMVIVGHCNPPKQVIFYHNYDLSWLVFSAGGVAVRIFFCLSGYLMGKVFYIDRYSENLPGFINFWRNRILRIFPLYYFSILICGWFFYPQIWKPENWPYLLRLLTFTYNHALPIEFNGPLWTLSTEVQFYLIVPFIYSYLKPRLLSYKQIFLWFFGVIAFCFVLRQGIWLAIASAETTSVNEDAAYFIQYIYTPLITNLDCFLGGFIINALLKLIKGDRRIFSQQFRKFIVYNKHQIAWMIVLFLYLITAFCKYYNQPLLVYISPTLIAILTSLFIFLVEYDEPESIHFRQKPFFNLSRIFQAIGKLSYGIYIWHAPIISLINPLVNLNHPLESFLLKFIATLTLSTLAAFLTYYLIELPAAKWKN